MQDKKSMSDRYTERLGLPTQQALTKDEDECL